MNDTRTCTGCGDDLHLSHFERLRTGNYRITCISCRRAKVPMKLLSQREAREQSLRDDIWAAMRRGRSLRAATAVKAHRTDTHRIKLRAERGYISTAELACRCAEREACHRAARTCKTFEAAAAAERILEQPTTPIERIKQLRNLWCGEPIRPPVLQALLGEDGSDEVDPFDEALGDWAPAWMGNARGSWSASLNL